MRITFCGAAGEVTGSCYHIETLRARVLLDFGMFQGSKLAAEKNCHKPPFDAARLDAVVLTHAHIDHVGRMPMLPVLGFGGGGGGQKIIATPSTCELARIMLEDSARLQEQDAEYQTRLIRRRMGDATPPILPLYTAEDARKILGLFDSLAYQTPREIAPGISIRFIDAGHILGAASVEMTVAEPGAPAKTIIFSGDIGVRGVPIMNDPQTFDRADIAILESTYGDRDHKPIDETVAEFEKIVHDAIWSKERLLMPAFAVGRSQMLMYFLSRLGRQGKLPDFPVYIDSPMAHKAFDVYRMHRDLLDDTSREILKYAESPGSIPSFSFIQDSQQSRTLNDQHGAAVIIAASGMCTGGRILHHLKHNLWRRDVHVVITGYQSEGSLGRRLVDGATLVRVLGDWITVRAKVHTLGGFSAHAGQSELVDWARPWAPSKPRTFLTHGEDKARNPLRDRLVNELNLDPQLPVFGQIVEL